jgi:hypothetical protein
MTTTVISLRWRTRPPSSVDERLMITDNGRARLDVLRPRTPSDTVGTYEGAVEDGEAQELIAAGSDVELDADGQDARLSPVAIAADRVAQRLLSSPLAAAQFFARPVGAVPPIPQTLAVGVLGSGSQPVEFQLDLAGCAIHFSSDGTPVSWIPLPELSMGFLTPQAEDLGGVRHRAIVEPGVLGSLSVPLDIPDGVNELSAYIVGSWFLPGEESSKDFEARTAPQPL